MNEDFSATPEQHLDPQTEALRLLASAEINGTRVPATFDGARFLRGLNEVRRMHAIWAAAEQPVVTEADRDSVSNLAFVAGRFAEALEALAYGWPRSPHLPRFADALGVRRGQY